MCVYAQPRDIIIILASLGPQQIVLSVTSPAATLAARVANAIVIAILYANIRKERILVNYFKYQTHKNAFKLLFFLNLLSGNMHFHKRILVNFLSLFTLRWFALRYFGLY